MILRRFYLDLFEPLKLRSRAANTKRLYRTTLENFKRFLEREPLLVDLNEETVNRFLGWFLALPRSPYSVNKERANLLCVWRWACQRRSPEGETYLKDWPAIDPEVEPLDEPIAWLDHELDLLFSVCRAQPGKVGKLQAGLFWYAMSCVLYDSGERISAIMGVTWDMVDLAGGWLILPARLRKGRRRGRTIKLHPQTIAALSLIREPEREKVFAWPYSYTYLWKKYGEVLRSGGLPADRYSKFHRMRKSVASHYEAAGGNATELLTHSSRRVTRRYLDRRIVGEKHASEMLRRPGDSGAKPE